MIIRYEAPRAEDAAALSHLAETTFKATFEHLYPPQDLADFLSTWMPPAKVAAQIADPAWTFQVARAADGALLGYIKLGPVDFDLPDSEPDTAPDTGDATELHQLYVAPAAQGTGVAATLMDWAMDTARAQRHRRVYLSVYIDNLRAQRFYARYGFYEIGKNPFRVGDTTDDDRIWRCDL